MDASVAPVVGAFAACFSALTAVVSVITAYKVAKMQRSTARDIAEMQRSLNQRQLLLPLWDYLTKVNDINPAAPVTTDVLHAVNTLELVALCCEGGMVDATVIKRTFRDGFMHHYQAIAACGMVPGKNKTGQQLLTENPAAMKFFEELKGDLLKRDALTKIGGK